MDLTGKRRSENVVINPSALQQGLTILQTGFRQTGDDLQRALLQALGMEDPRLKALRENLGEILSQHKQKPTVKYSKEKMKRIGE